MNQFVADWPDNADGGVFRRLKASGFDFSQAHSVDYNIDFENWPPSSEAIAILQSMYGDLSVYEPDEHGAGYVQFQIVGQVTYEGVTSVQRRTSAAMKPFGGVCESWGVMQ